MVEQFQDQAPHDRATNPTILVTSFALGGTGYTLNRANKFFVHDRDIDRKKLLQAEKRLLRLDTHHRVEEVMLVCKEVPCEAATITKQKNAQFWAETADRTQEAAEAETRAEAKKKEENTAGKSAAAEMKV